ncbi:hypothetical protein MSAN_02346000 [Mycena sanguinolenta]|uniref:Uncharacterized protein n=1 Tax=Mycena sanguinolenta TaxID=230812 RepID=A0A8H7CGR0_9AGAR|nr:hypothetical protein MSAN_02346000 [Mycena sanguinolenta]
MRAIQLWVRAVLKNTHFAERAHALALSLPDKFEVSDATKLGRALGKMWTYPNSIHWWLINNCSFRLTKFENFYFEDERMVEFWKNQTELQVLVTFTCSCLKTTAVLPQVIALEAANLFDLPEGRALQRVSTRLDSNYIRRLALCTAVTLTSLYLWRGRRQYMSSIGHGITTVATYLPGLVHLVIVEQREDYVPLNEKVSTTTLQLFSKLETLVLQMMNIARFVIDNGAMHEMNTAAGIYGLGNEFMMGCPKVRRVAIRAEVEEQVLASVVTRSQGGEIREESRTVVDFDTSDMFWNQ